uniref:Choline/ethanolamine kinase n=1 Tax=uncultured marine crenarchaeote E37-7F TaxID=907717 RepID=G9BAQ3_9ARCH|nr:choline/ethanolamine kinase [uncultured marine crenarchaeote E37-7F]
MANPLDHKIKEYLRKLDPTILDIDNIQSISTHKIGLGESNLNYLAIINGKKFNIRINMYPHFPKKSENEFNSLKIVEPLGITPKVFHYEASKEILGETFIILEYLDGRSLNKYKKIGGDVIRKLGVAVAQLHNTNINNIENRLKRHGSSKMDLLNIIKQMIEYINRKRKHYFPIRGVFENVLEKSYKHLQRLNFPIKPSYVLGHGDIDPSNVISSQRKLKLIDWEDLGLMDPALEIVGLFDSFDLSNKEKELFLKGYLEVREDTSLKKKLPIFLPFQIFRVFCWAIMHIYELGEGETNEVFLKEQDLKEHIDYTEKMFTKCKKAEIIDKDVRWNISEIVPEHYLKLTT